MKLSRWLRGILIAAGNSRKCHFRDLTLYIIVNTETLVVVWITEKYCAVAGGRTCLADHIGYSENAVVGCPFNNGEYKCQSTLQDREIRAVSLSINLIQQSVNLPASVAQLIASRYALPGYGDRRV